MSTAAPGGPVRRSDAASAVLAFHLAFGLPTRTMPSVEVDPSTTELRIGLLIEEVAEFARAARAGNIIGIADGLADIVYVAYGAAVTYGIDLDAALAEVHRANMSKLDGSGRPVLRDDGKVVKSDRYRPPDIAGVLDTQVPLR
jgi:predicted HAD superfamily Cof-like phosphohydrolase